MNEISDRTYEIPESLIPDLESRIEKLNRRADRLGVSRVSIQQGETWMKRIDTRSPADPLYDPETDFYLRPTVNVAIVGETPMLGGWQFAATIQHDELEEGKAANMLRKAPGFSIDLPAKYRTTSPDLCEHCGKNRNRVDTYIVYHAGTGEWKQVGSNCLGDFTGTNNPHKIAAWLEALLDLNRVMSEYEENEGGSTSTPALPLEAYVAMCAAAIREYGWLSRGKAREMTPYPGYATADRAADQFNNARMKTEDKIHPTDEDRERAKAAIEWARETWTPGDDLSDYEWTMMVALQNDFVEYRRFGFVASVLNAHQRATEKAVERARALATKANEYMGEVGQKKFQVTATLMRDHEYEGAYGAAHIYTFETAEGNTVVWFTGNQFIEVGHAFTITGTIKAHEDYKGLHQTVMTRCKLVAIETA